jgi:hypothetical protein
MIAIDGCVVTTAMSEAGSKMATDCVVVRCEMMLEKRDDSHLVNWDNYRVNQDILKAYADDDINSVEAIYLAMDRAK